VFWSLILCNAIIPQLLWSSRLRSNLLVLFLVSMAVNVGMWLERFIIIVTSLHRPFLPARWGYFQPTFWDIATFAGTIGLFLTLMVLFIRVLPLISIAEMRELVHEKAEGTH
jgi:molybdopterin-containing oxidoreductase family membrane subunit